MKLDSAYFNILRAKPKQVYRSSAHKEARKDASAKDASAEDASAEDDTSCAHSTCRRTGNFRAPKETPFENKKVEWLYFCRIHIEYYNRTYDYFATATPEQIIAFIKAEDIGHRPTWRLGRGPKKLSVEAMRDRFNFFEREKQKRRDKVRAETPNAPKALTAHVQDLEILGLDDKASEAEVKSRFKALVKLYHPDLNGGERKYEHRLSAVIESYNKLKQAM